jgi:hypothetical protein
MLVKLRSFNMSDGIVSGERAMGTPGLVQLSTPLQPGNSGGPIVDEQGRVAGVVAARLSEGQSVGFGLQGRVLREFLDSNQLDYTVASSTEIVDTKRLAEMATQFTRPLLCLTESL